MIPVARYGFTFAAGGGHEKDGSSQIRSSPGSTGSLLSVAGRIFRSGYSMNANVRLQEPFVMGNRKIYPVVFEETMILESGMVG